MTTRIRLYPEGNYYSIAKNSDPFAKVTLDDFNSEAVLSLGRLKALRHFHKTR